MVEDLDVQEKMQRMHRRAFVLHQQAFELWQEKGDTERAQLALRRAREEREALAVYGGDTLTDDA